MFRHLLKIAWSQKRTNALIVIEMFISFIVVAALAIGGLYLAGSYRAPLGFDHREIWVIELDRPQGRESASPVERQLAAQLIDGARGVEGVLAAAGMSTGPYLGSISRTGWEFEGRQLEAETAWASDELPATLGLRIVEGRWFGPEDDARAWDPVVVNRILASSIFGAESPLDRVIYSSNEPGAREWRIVGVVDEFRRGGELQPPGEFMFQRLAGSMEQLSVLQVRVAPGARADLEPVLLAQLQSIVPDWTLQLTTIEELRHRYLQKFGAAFVLAAAIGGFLILMVMLGLTGVLWQNVTRRTREIGLRRAAGASRVQVLRQIVGEVMITTGLASILGVVLVSQLLLLAPFAFLPSSIVVTALGLALGFLLLLSALCGLYPGWSATHVPPAVALHHD